MAERETSLSTINDNGNKIPKVSFASKSETGNQKLEIEHYDIGGLDITAWYDDTHKLLVVLDSTVSSNKPNALLVLNPSDDRKWDDILENDFGIAPDSVRPRVDNKYQNLDTEYDGLAIYNKLINDYNSGDDLTDALDALAEFHFNAVRRSAAERLADADRIMAAADITIAKTNENLAELMARMDDLNTKLNTVKKSIGKIPTKQSASKILRLESQIEELDEKIARANRRIVNAEKRIAAASADADIARQILKKKQVSDEIITNEPKADDMAEEVKPLFENDPNIMDENIAFKPIKFSAETARPADAPIVSPLSFTPPVMSEPVAEPEPVAAPVSPSSFAPITDVPDVENFATGYAPITQPEPIVEPVIAPIPVVEPVAEPVIEPVVAPAPAAPYVRNDVDVRPASPTATAPTPVSDNDNSRKPSVLYYILLVILIVLSIFTLWLYQKNTVDTTPEITTVVPVTTLPATIDQLPEPIPTPAPVFMAQVPIPQPIEVMPEPAPVDIPTNDQFGPVVEEPVYNTQPIVQDTIVETVTVYEKPSYDVSGERRFMTEAEYYDAQQAAGGPGEYYIPDDTAVGTYYQEDYIETPEYIEDDIYYDDGNGEIYERYERYDAVYEQEY